MSLIKINSNQPQILWHCTTHAKVGKKLQGKIVKYTTYLTDCGRKIVDTISIVSEIKGFFVKLVLN